MRSFCLTVLISTTFLCLPEAVLAASVPTQAQYIYGSVKSIPADATGALDLTDAKDLQFQYGSDGYKLPYGKIKSYEFTESKGETRTIGGVPLPKLPFLGRQEILNLSFYGEQGGINTMSFRVTARNLSTIEWVLSQRVEAERRAAESASRTKLPEAWWGDKWWKTNRNKPVWPDAAAEPAGTK